MSDCNNIEDVPCIELNDEELSIVSGGGIYISLGGNIKGDNTKEGHERWIELQS